MGDITTDGETILSKFVQREEDMADVKPLSETTIWNCCDQCDNKFKEAKTYKLKWQELSDKEKEILGQTPKLKRPFGWNCNCGQCVEKFGEHSLEKHPTENKYPNQTTLWKEIDQELYQLHLDKNMDYSPANIVVVGMPGLIVRMWDKVSRLFNLYGVNFPCMTDRLEQARTDLLKNVVGICNNYNLDKQIQKQLTDTIDSKFVILQNDTGVDWSRFKEQPPKNESIDDTLKDLRNYAQIAIIHKEGKWGK